jgi:hypothetical protein
VEQHVEAFLAIVDSQTIMVRFLATELLLHFFCPIKQKHANHAKQERLVLAVSLGFASYYDNCACGGPQLRVGLTLPKLIINLSGMVGHSMPVLNYWKDRAASLLSLEEAYEKLSADISRKEPKIGWKLVRRSL